MKVTNVYFNEFDGGATKGFATVEFDDALVVKGLKLIEGSNGYFIGFPSKQGKDGEWRDEVYSKNPELTADILNAVLAKAGLDESPF